MYDVTVLDLSYSDTKAQIAKISDSLLPSASVFCICQTSYDDFGNVENDVFDFIKLGLENGLEYINTIVFPTKDFSSYVFKDNICYIVWFCKDKTKVYFDKDAIREKHIWKDVEWGKREKNYNKKGKDPGNVWIPTLDDGKGKITEHILMTKSDVITRILKSTYKNNAKIITNNEDLKKDFTEYKCDFDFIPNKAIKPSKQAQSDFAKGKSINTPISGKIVFGTSEAMDRVKDKSVKTIVTSPPYWNLKDYFKKGQIGQEPYDTYLSRMYKVWEECFDKLQEDGSLWVNINVRVKDGNVLLIPSDFIAQCKKIGYFYKGIVIWHKSSGIPTHAKNIVDRFEYVLVFSKDNNFCLNLEEFNSFCDYKNDFINGGSIWNINRKAGSVGPKFIHPAIYPNELVERIVKCSSQNGDVVLDPFLGSGTSLIACMNTGRSFIGYEYNEGFKELMLSRFDKELKNKNIEFI